MRNELVVEISSRDYWFKVVEMLQQNWALIDETSTGCMVYFFHDRSGVFDQLSFGSIPEAEAALDRNGFCRHAQADKDDQEFFATPQPPFHPVAHPNGPVYSSGRFWR